ncbi:hypothetical protein [Syntrophothermus lipocalidus]|uniref:Uncharacterized protein n=1 Tax=Syntrophothermus lipocalidus (strain DSM 12680 / TGB-C1) TaxID=643648 RepID=D7CNU0_SYNLT|nr:hypothetical protein [Syntrophothermus lipocalidus]ADI02375.1 hypothetical protein Slip_1616 [Syntrophothermus lipocalidus DSM 12680]
MSDKIVCPECGSNNVVPIVYGLPTWELRQKAEEGKIRLGGCCIYENSPRFACNDCNCAWGGEKSSGKKYEEIRRIKASIGHHCDSSLNVCVEIDLIACRVSWNQGLYKQVSFEKPIDAASAKKFIERLRQLRVLNWGQRYDNPGVLDGTQWSIEVGFGEVCTVKGGSNAYPKEWDGFCRLIQDVAGRPFK